jgi:hypothetical protein
MGCGRGEEFAIVNTTIKPTNEQDNVTIRERFESSGGGERCRRESVIDEFNAIGLVNQGEATGEWSELVGGSQSRLTDVGNVGV